MESKFGSLTIPELKNELRKRNARLAGRKSELVERLVAYERNKHFGQPDVMGPDFTMSLPEPEKYFDVNSDSKFNGVNLDEAHQFLFKFDKHLDTHIQRLYDETFIKYVRYTSTDDNYFIKASCHAEMKRDICYTVDICVSLMGSVLESQCECAAGMGPTAHCKHVSLVLYGLSLFSKKRTIKTEETCTQRLQTFHKCKKFIGSPMKSSSLEILAADEFTNVDFDPRPEHLRNLPSYKDHFRNTCLNFPGISNLPIFQTFEPANTLAVAHDHDYFELTPEDNFLQLLQVSFISESQVKSIERKTLGQSSNAIWKTERTKRLSSSMFGKICKATDRTDKHELAKSLTKIKNIKAAPLEHGRRYEQIAIERFSKDTGTKVDPCGLCVCQNSPFISASPDGIIDEHHIIEVKCPYSSRDREISPVTVPYLKLVNNDQLSLDESHDYFYQIQGQMLCTGAKKCTLIVCTADKLKIKDIKYINIDRNNPFISKLKEDLKHFYEKYFKEALLETFFYKSYHL